MAILVDEAQAWPARELPFPRWCHMVSDRSYEELHAFAGLLGVPRQRFQDDHYDLPEHLRERALARGAQAVGAGELVRRMAGPRGERVRARRAAREPR